MEERSFLCIGFIISKFKVSTFPVSCPGNLWGTVIGTYMGSSLEAILHEFVDTHIRHLVLTEKLGSLFCLIFDWYKKNIDIKMSQIKYANTSNYIYHHRQHNSVDLHFLMSVFLLAFHLMASQFGTTVSHGDTSQWDEINYISSQCVAMVSPETRALPGRVDLTCVSLTLPTGSCLHAVLHKLDMWPNMNWILSMRQASAAGQPIWSM